MRHLSTSSNPVLSILALSAFAAFAASAACGGGAPPAATPAPAGSVAVTGTVTSETPAQRKLAHFRTPDGMVGLVLDRTGGKPKYQLDGKTEIVVLTQKEEREKWGDRLEGYFMVDPAGKRVFFIDEGGGITYQPDRDRLSLMFDTDAKPLGAATVAGTYTPPAPAWKPTADRLTAIAVRTKFPDFKPEESANLGKVSDAIGKATADMFVHYATHGQSDWLPHLVFVPRSQTALLVAQGGGSASARSGCAKA